MKKIFTTALLSLPVLAMAGVMNGSGINADDNSKNPTQGKNNSALPCATYAAPTASAVAVCAGTDAVLSATGTGAAELLWFSQATGGTMISNGATLTVPTTTPNTLHYWVEENELTGCPENARTEVIVTVNFMPTADANEDTTVCPGVIFTLPAPTYNAGPAYWYNDTVTFGPSTPQTVTAERTYTFKVTAGACVATDYITVFVHDVVPAMVTLVSGDMVLCDNAVDPSVELTVSAAAGSTFAWDGDPVLTTQNVTYEAAGIYGVTVTDENECVSHDSIWIHVSPITSVSVTGNVLCAGVESTTLVAVNNAADHFEWESGEETAELTVTEAGEYDVTVSNEFGCEYTYTAVVTEGELPTVSAGVDQAVCAGTEVTLHATAVDAEDIEWNNEVVDNEAFTPTETATYIVLATAANGCEDTDTVTVTVNFMPSADANEDTTVCSGMTFTLPAGTYNAMPSYSDGVNAPFNPGVPQNITTETTYTLTVTAGTCVATDEITVFVNPTPVATATLTGVATLNAATAPGQTYQWINCTTDAPIAGATAATYEATANGSYKVEVSNGTCEATSACVNVTTLGVAENTADLGITLYPNPTTGKVFVSTSNNEAVAVTVYNAQGAVVAAFGKVQNGEVIELTNVEAGIYVIRVATAQGTAVSRIVKN